MVHTFVAFPSYILVAVGAGPASVCAAWSTASSGEPVQRLWHFPTWGGEWGRMLTLGKFNSISVRHPQDFRELVTLPTKRMC
eukprot:gene1084-4756_t